MTRGFRTGKGYNIARLRPGCQVPSVQSKAVEVRWPYNQGMGRSRRITGSSLLENSIFSNQGRLRRLISALLKERGSPCNSLEPNFTSLRNTHSRSTLLLDLSEYCQQYKAYPSPPQFPPRAFSTRRSSIYLSSLATYWHHCLIQVAVSAKGYNPASCCSWI
jgi:hypothetical protein